jgi:hypothetical protein
MYEDSLILKYEQTLIKTNYLIKNNIQLYIFLRIARLYSIFNGLLNLSRGD